MYLDRLLHWPLDHVDLAASERLHLQAALAVGLRENRVTFCELEPRRLAVHQERVKVGGGCPARRRLTELVVDYAQIPGVGMLQITVFLRCHHQEAVVCCLYLCASPLALGASPIATEFLD